MAGALIRHVRDHVRYVVVDEYQDTNPIQEKLIERLCRFGANLCVVGDDDQTIYQWRGSAVSQHLDVHRAARRTCARSRWTTTSAPSPGIVALGREVAARNDPDRLPKNMVAAGHQTVRARRHAGADLRLGGRRGGVDLRPDRAAARRPVHGRPGGAAARAVLVGLRGAVPLGVQGRGRACRRAAAPVDPVRDQGADPAVRRARGAGVRGLLPVRAARGDRGRRGGRVARRRRRGDPGGAARRRCRSWRRRGTGSRASGGARTTSSAPTCGSSRPSSIREETVRRSRGARPGPRRAASWSSTTSASSARRSPTSSRSTSSPRRRPSTTRS